MSNESRRTEPLSLPVDDLTAAYATGRTLRNHGISGITFFQGLRDYQLFTKAVAVIDTGEGGAVGVFVDGPEPKKALFQTAYEIAREIGQGSNHPVTNGGYADQVREAILPHVRAYVSMLEGHYPK